MKQLLVLFFSVFSVAAAWSDELYVAVNDPNAADDTATGRGSEKLPYKTIQAAVTKAKTGSTIYVKPGDYRDGGLVMDGNGLLTRVKISGKVIHLKSTDGAAQTRILGKRQAETEGKETDAGCGPDAETCIYVYGGDGTTIEGFTLANGATRAEGADVARKGAAFRSSSKNVFLIDCLVTNCTAKHSSCMSGGTAIRCRFFNNSCSAFNDVNCCYLYNCIIGGRSWQGQTLIVSRANFVNCTFAGTSSYSGVVADMDRQYYLNCLFAGNRNRNNIFCEFAGPKPARTNCTTSVDNTQYQVFAPVLGDYTPIAGSAAETTGDGKYVSALDDLLPEGYSGYDIFTNAIPTSGSICVGAIQGAKAVPCGRIDFADSLTIDGHEATKYDWVYPDSAARTYKIGPSASSGKKLLSVKAKLSTTGATTEIAADADGFVTIAAPADIGSVLTLTPVLYAEWYVDAENGDDQNAGTSAALAKRTLADVVTNTTIAANDIIHAAPGMYSNGVMRCSSNSVIYARVVLPKSVSLVADGSAANTFIVGAPAPLDQPGRDEWGCGTNAVRCVWLNDYSTVRGFTLCGGRTLGIKDTASNRDDVGSGVCGTSRLHSRVEDCIISNNVQYSFAASKVMLVRSRIVENRGLYVYGGTGDGAGLHYCLVDRNIGIGAHYPEDVIGCTFGPNNRTAKGERADDMTVWGTFSGKKYYNSVVFYTKRWNDCFQNCAFGEESADAVGEMGPGSVIGNLRLRRKNYIPLENSPVIDAGDLAYAGDDLPEADLNGNPRVVDGKIDIGVAEYAPYDGPGMMLMIR